MRFPSSIFVSVSLFTAETTAALYLSSTYRSAGDQIWQGLTLLFTLVPSVLVQLTLTFIHRDLSRDRPLILLLHILQLGPIVRCLEAFCIYGSVGRVEEPYVSITRKKQMPRRGQAEEVERQVGQAEGKLFTHRAAFARTSVIQAFLGSAPQLTLQLYICVLQQGVSIGRGEGSTYDVSVCLCGTGQFYGSSTHPALLRVRHRSSTMWADQLSAILEMREWMFS